MSEPQHLQENSGSRAPNSWLSGAAAASHDISSLPTHRHALSQLAATITSASADGSFDRILYNSLVDVFPLVETLISGIIGSKIGKPTVASQGEMIDSKERDAAQFIPTKRKRNHGDKDQGKCASSNQDSDGFSIFPSRAFTAEKGMEELVILREEVEDLQKKLLEKDELLKSAEILKNQIETVCAKFNELKIQAAEKDSLVKSIRQQLHDGKLADKQAALEKDTVGSNGIQHKSREALGRARLRAREHFIIYDALLECLAENYFKAYADKYDVKACYLEHLPDADDSDDMEMLKMEEARESCVAAHSAAKEKQNEGSITAAASARLHLQSFVCRSNHMNATKASFHIGVS